MSENRRSYEFDRERRERYASNPVQWYLENLRKKPVDHEVYKVAELVIERAWNTDPTISRRDLAIAVFHRFTKTTDRKIRKIKEELFKIHGIPIVGISTDEGYFLITNESQRDAAMKEHIGRRDKENEYIRMLGNIDFGKTYTPPTPINQIRMDF